MNPTIDSRRLTSFTVKIPYFGAWFADGDLDEQATVVGRVSVECGTLTLAGTVMPAFSGDFGMRTLVRVVGGAGGWSNLLPAKHYHNDAGVKTATIVEDAARECGETLGAVTYAVERVGVDWTRQAGPACRVLRALAEPWWINSAGLTRIGTRVDTEVVVPYEVLDYDPRMRVAELVTDDLAGIPIGSVLRAPDRLPSPLFVRELELRVADGKLRLAAWGVLL